MKHISERVEELFGDYHDWYPKLCALARVGYPSGGNGRGSGVPRPTEQAALGRDAVAMIRKEHDRDIQQFLNLVHKIEKRKAWLSVTDAKQYDPPPLACEVCYTPITGIGNDVQREGKCERCYRHDRKHGLPWPHTHRKVSR